METPTLNKKQQKATLSARKARTKEVIKNVVATPYTSYWPQISLEDHNTLKQILEQNLPKIALEKVNTPWRFVQNLPKSERKEFRKEYEKNCKTAIKRHDRKGVVIGINEVTKLLEKNLASIVIISGDVQPRLMVQHIIDQAVLYKVPVIIFDDLKNLLKKICGIGSTVLSLNRDADTDSKLNLIKESVTQIYEKCPAPVHHINYNRSLEPKVVQSDQTTQKYPSIENTINEDEIRQNIHLKRESTCRRAFVPEDNDKPLKNGKMDVDSAGFLAFSQEPTMEIDSRVKSVFKSLIVKRLKGNPNRNKRLIETLKKN